MSEPALGTMDCAHAWEGAIDAFYTEVYSICKLCGAEKHPNPRRRLLVGLGEGSDGELRVYVDARWRNRWFEIWDYEDQQKVRRAWRSNGHVHVLVHDATLNEAVGPVR